MKKYEDKDYSLAIHLYKSDKKFKDLSDMIIKLLKEEYDPAVIREATEFGITIGIQSNLCTDLFKDLQGFQLVSKVCIDPFREE